MEQARIADLPQLPLREDQAAIGAVGRGIDRLGQPHGEVGHPARMAAGHGIPGLDGRHRGRHEALEQLLDLLAQLGVLHGHGRLPRQALGQVLVSGGEAAYAFRILI